MSLVNSMPQAREKVQQKQQERAQNQMASKYTLDEVILSLPVMHRFVVAEMKQQLSEQAQRLAELEADLNVCRQRNAELEMELKSREIPQVQIVSSARSLEELLTAMKQEHTAKVDKLVRATAERVRTLEDPQFDAHSTLLNRIKNSMKSLPMDFQFVNLLQARQSLASDGYTPTSPVQVPLIEEFISHIDGVRQCVKDGATCFMHRDPTVSDVLRKMFDVCKSVELKLGDTSHLTLPPLAINFDVHQFLKESSDVTFLRSKETGEHTTTINHCGEVFERAVREIKSLEEQSATVSQLPLLLNKFETLITAAHNDVENILQNVCTVRDGGKLLKETLFMHKATLQERHESFMSQVREKVQERDNIVDEITRRLQDMADLHIQIEGLYEQTGEKTVEIATCDHRAIEVDKATDQEVVGQNRYQEGLRFTIHLVTKSKELYRRLFNNLEEMIRNRHAICQQTKNSSQEQLYTMAENLHDVITKRIQADNLQVRIDQQALDAANRSLMGLVHAPQEMEKAMQQIRNYTASIASAKQRMTQNQADIQSIKQIFQRYGTLQYLRRDSNFLSMFETVEKAAKLKEKMDEMTQRVKFVSEVLVEISDPETRQDFVVTQCIEAIKQTVTDVNDLLPLKSKIEELEESYRVSAATRIRRHMKLIQHFCSEMETSEDDLLQREPALQAHTQSLLTGLQVIMSAITHNDDMLIGANQRSAYVTAAISGVQSYYNPEGVSASVLGQQQNERDASEFFSSGRVVAGKGAVVAAGSGDVAKPSGGGLISAAQGKSAIESLSADFLQGDLVQHTFARVSDNLRLSHDNRRCTKLNCPLEMSNTSALGNVGFRAGTGIHKFSVRILQNCGRLLVGFADWNLPVDGYCNSIKYPSCYYLHLGNGTLWCPDQKFERKPYTFEAIGASVGGVLSCIIDTNERTIGFVWRDTNLGVAFRNVNMTRTLYPAFEAYNNACAFEFIQVLKEGQEGQPNADKQNAGR